MKRYALLFVFIFMSMIVFAQDMPFTFRSTTRYSASSMIGKVEIDSVKYHQLRFIQEFSYKKFGLGLDLDFLFDKNYKLKKNDWDHLDDIIGKFYYFRYAEIGDPFFFHIGGFSNYTVGNGLVMLTYSNMQYYPDQRHNGLLIGGSLETRFKPQLQIFSSDIQKNQILAMNTKIQPLPDSTLKYIDQGILGLSLYVDRNQYGNLEYTLGDSLYQVYKPEDNDSVVIVGLDYTQPFFEYDKAKFGVYTEMAHIFDSGTGFILPGVYADFNVIKLNLEYRVHGDKFTPGFFDHFYEEERAMLDTLSMMVVSKQKSVDQLKASYGFYGRIEATIARKFKTLVAWQNMYGNEMKNGKSLWFSLNLDTQYKRLEKIGVSYSKTGVDKLRLGKVAVPRARLSTSITMSLNDKRRWFIIGKYSEKYPDKEGGIKWWKDTQRSFGIGVKYSF
nr:hypothetical protein [Candidatus Cloacimonadota bacterium]